jgi:hypothetical protein
MSGSGSKREWQLEFGVEVEVGVAVKIINSKEGNTVLHHCTHYYTNTTPLLYRYASITGALRINSSCTPAP